jgi:hypothetical protein
MNSENIKPEKITKPIQLLAAWLLGLILINGSFLTAASQIAKPTWITGALIIATMVNVPIFLVSLFLLQTKFRPEMQEDTYYSKYLERKYNSSTIQRQIEQVQVVEEKETENVAELITKKLTDSKKDKKTEIESILKERDKQRIQRRIGESRALSEIYLYPEKWSDLIKRWGKNEDFNRDIEELYFYGVIQGDLHDPISIKLTPLGKEVAKKLEEEKKLWHHTHDTKEHTSK